MQNQVELQQNLTNQIENLKSISAVSLGTFFIIILIMGIFISKSITKPITKLIKSVEKITKFLKEEAKNGKTIIFSTHIKEDLENLADIIYKIDNGTIYENQG